MNRNSILIGTLSITAALFLSACGGGSSSNKALEFMTPATKSMAENSTSVFTATLSEADINDLSYTIAGGADADKFTVDPASGTLTFKTAPDYENPTDANQDNIYEVTITATDGKRNATRTFLITITDDKSDNGPVFTSPDSTSTLENRQLDFDISAPGAVSFAISGGVDGKLFILKREDSKTKLLFNHFRPDFDYSSDRDHDNLYQVTVRATDDQNHSSVQKISVAVTNDSADDNYKAIHRPVYKTGADDGVVAGLPFGDDRNFTAETLDSKRVIKIGKRYWEDSPKNRTKNYSFGDAENYCSNLDIGGMQWRVPSILEMAEIIDYGKTYSSEPTIDAIFQNKTKGYYWTSQTILNYGNNTVDNQGFATWFTNGLTDLEDMGDTHYVRCVAGPKVQDSDLDAEIIDGTIVDHSTGLQWAKDTDNHSYQSEKERCENLVFSGYDDWRMPNINELHTIEPHYDEKLLITNPAGDVIKGPFWSSTPIDETHNFYVANYWYAPSGRDVIKDKIEPTASANSSGAICVRGGHL